jgi:hypothetical protein
MHCVFISFFSFVASRLGHFVKHTLVAWVGLCLPLVENMRSLLTSIQRKDIFICDFIIVVKVC